MAERLRRVRRKISDLTDSSINIQTLTAKNRRQRDALTNEEIARIKVRQKKVTAPLIEQIGLLDKRAEKMRHPNGLLIKKTAKEYWKLSSKRSELRADLDNLNKTYNQQIGAVEGVARAKNRKERDERIKVVKETNRQIYEIERDYRRSLEGEGGRGLASVRRKPAELTKAETAELKKLINKPADQRTKADKDRMSALYTERQGPVDASKLTRVDAKDNIVIDADHTSEKYARRKYNIKQGFEVPKQTEDELSTKDRQAIKKALQDDRKVPDTTGEQSSPDIEGDDPRTSPEVNQQDRWERDPEVIEEEVPISDIEKKERHQAMLKGIQSLLGVQESLASIGQARLQYNQIQGQSDINKALINDEIQDILAAGNQRAAIEHARGKTAAESDQLRLAAQGQNLSGAGAERVEQSHQIMAAANAADARSASIARGLGLEYEKVSINRQLAYADINKTSATWRGLTSAAFGLAEAGIHAQRSKFWKGDTKTVFKEIKKEQGGRIIKRRTREVEDYKSDAVAQTDAVRRAYRKYRMG